MAETYTSRAMLEKLIGFDTVSRNSNMQLIDFVSDYLKSHGVEANLVPNETGDKANLYATVGPNVEGGVVLSGHTDVVPVDGQQWASDPFTLTEREGKFFGRGTCDMKAFFAIGLALVPQMLSAKIKKPVHFALSYDEEIGCCGAPHMIKEMLDTVPKPLGVIVGEPTSMKVVTAHKASLGFFTHVRGHSAHSSQVNRGVSAVAVGARLVTWLDDQMRANKKRTSAHSHYDPPYTSLHTGTIEGGTAGNILAKDCRFETDIRAIDEDDPHDFLDAYLSYIRDEIEPEMKAFSEDCFVQVDLRSDVPGLKAEAESAAEELCRLLTGDNDAHIVSYATEAGQFQDVGHSVAICGPGSIDQAHKPDEFLEISQFEAGIRFQERLIEYLAR